MAQNLSQLPNLLTAKAGDLTTQDLALLKQQVASLPGGGSWAPSNHGGMCWGVTANRTDLLLVPKAPNAFPTDADRQQMSNAAAFAGYSPAYVLRLISEVEKLQLELAAARTTPPPPTTDMRPENPKP